MSHKELTSSADRFRRYSEEGAAVVNCLFGLDISATLPATLPADHPPPRLCLGKFWKEVSPVLEQHPIDRELYVGWDLINGRLQIAEIVEGMQTAEIQAENAKHVREGKPQLASSALGLVRHQSHLLSFHSHVLNHYLVDPPQDRYKWISFATPRSSYDDLSSLILFPQEYGQVVLDIKLQKKRFVGRIMLCFKTTSSWRIEESNYEELEQRLIREMYFSDALNFHEDFATTVQLPSRQINPGTRDALKRLQSDEHWWKFTGTVVYRGLVSTDLNINSTALRWDLFYQKLMGLRKSERKKRWWFW